MSCRRWSRLKAVDAGVDGLVVEGGEGGGFKNPRDVSTMVLLPLVCSKVGLSVIAAGGITDGRTMAAAFALGAEGVQMGTRMVSAADSRSTTIGKTPSSRRRRRIPSSSTASAQDPLCAPCVPKNRPVRTGAAAGPL